ncbi:MAG: YajQ family cyclic di-GMP-binding protein [Campylobacterales bacterium]
MAKEHSFDIAARMEMMELKNALSQTEKEIETRFDFKGVTKEITLNEKEKTVVILTSGENKLEAITDILFGRMIKRGLEPKCLKKEKSESASGGNVRATYKIHDTLTAEIAKKVTAAIKESGLKLQSAIQGDAIRVKAKSIDDLQALIAYLRKQEFEVPLIFENYR